MLLHPHIKHYLLTGLEATPVVLDSLLSELAEEDPRWDLRPDPERFTLREILAHLADWDPIFLYRAERILAEEEPELEDCDEGQIAIERDYAHQSPHANLKRFQADRIRTVAFFRSLPEKDWDRAGHRPPVLGRLTLEAIATLIIAHDGYHLQQITQWLRFPMS